MKLVRNRILLAKLESTPGSDSNPVVGSNAVETKSPIVINWNANVLNRDNIRGNISAMPPVIGQRWAEINFQVELRGSGSVGVAGQLSALLQACAMSEAVSAGSSVVYLPTSPNQSTITMYIYDLDSGSCVLNKFVGCVGDWSWGGKAGELSYLDFKFKGLILSTADAALPSSPTYETTVAPVVQSASFSIKSIGTLIVQQLSISLGNNIGSRDDINSSAGLKGFFVTNRAPKASLNPEENTVAEWDKLADWAASTQMALSVQIGSTAGNICTITAPKAVLDSIKDADKNGIAAHELALSLGLSSGNDEIKLKFT